jgi:hypothetical protein
MPESNSTTETWKPVTGFEGIYEVSNHGKVRRVAYLIKPSNHTFGYKKVTLWKAQKPFQKYVHDLVSFEFIGPKPEGKYVGHGDDDPANNHLDNLSYLTPLKNVHDAIDRRRWTHKWAGRHKFSNRDVCAIRMLRGAGYRQWQIAKWFDTTQGVISKIVNRLARNHMSYYVD